MIFTKSFTKCFPKARPQFMKLTAVVASSALLVAGCSSTSESEANANTSSTSEASESTSIGDTRTVTDSEGTQVEVSTNPQRVVTLHFAATEAILDLGIIPVGQGSYATGLLPEDSEKDVIDVPAVNDTDVVQLEKIAALEPDLILAPNVTDAADVEKLREIAPTYVYTHAGEDRSNWSGRVEEIADAVNRSDAAKALKETLVARQKELASQYSEFLKTIRLGIIGSYSEQEVALQGDQSMVANILLPVGAHWSEKENEVTAGEEGSEREVSLEELEKSVGDADVLLYGTNLRAEPNDNLKGVMESAIYQSLQAVQAGQSYPIGKMTIAGYTDAMYTLDLFEDLLTDLTK